MNDPDDRPWRRTEASVHLRVRLTPKGGRDTVDGTTTTPDGPALKTRVRAAPEDGEANAALIELIAAWLDVPKRTVTLESGHKSRTKMLAISGNAATIEQQLRTNLTALTDLQARQTAKRTEKHR